MKTHSDELTLFVAVVEAAAFARRRRTSAWTIPW